MEAEGYEKRRDVYEKGEEVYRKKNGILLM